MRLRIAVAVAVLGGLGAGCAPEGHTTAVASAPSPTASSDVPDAAVARGAPGAGGPKDAASTAFGGGQDADLPDTLASERGAGAAPAPNGPGDASRAARTEDGDAIATGPPPRSEDDDADAGAPQDAVQPAADTAIACNPDAPVCADLPWKASLSRYPIVLVHGAAGWGQFGPVEYFWKVREELEKFGYAVYVPVLDPYNSSEVRGAQLASYIVDLLGCICRDKVNLIAHSEGGLDARYAISVLGLAPHVASLTTIATPHHGTPIASVALGLDVGPVSDAVDAFLWFVGEVYTRSELPVDFAAALEEFTPEGAEAFNAAVPDAPGVAYYSVAGRAGLFADGHPECDDGLWPDANPGAHGPVHALLWPTWVALGGLDGADNDGLVPVDSAKWGTFLGCVPADHIREVGHFAGLTPGFDHLAFYRKLAEFIRSQGY